jgi:hypothetical protein
MRKAIAIFFLFVFSASFTEAGQFIKLPLLLEHYVKHRGLDNTLSFASFINQHYLKEHRSDGDEKQDNQLPFKNDTVNTTSAVFLPAIATVLPQPVAGTARVFDLPELRFVISDHLFGIFHPPRIV